MPHFNRISAGDTIDLIGPHPYNMHRSNPYPEDHPMVRQLPEFHRFVRDRGLPWKVWADEVGFSSFRLAATTPQAIYTPCSELEQAQLLVRMMVTQLANGVDKLFWYDFRNDGTDPTWPEHNFGLIRYDNTPKPALVAYANLIHHLRQARWLGTYTIGGGGIAYAFADRAGQPKLVAWVRKGSTTEILRVLSDVSALHVRDIFGSVTTGPVSNHQFALELSATPVFVEGLTEADLKPFLETRDVHRR